MQEAQVNCLRCIGGPFDGETVELDARSRGTMMRSKSDSYAHYYERNPENDEELILKRSAHIMEFTTEVRQLKRPLSDKCCKCGKSQPVSGFEIFISPFDSDVCFPICQPCVSRMDSDEHEALRDRLKQEAFNPEKLSLDEF